MNSPKSITVLLFLLFAITLCGQESGEIIKKSFIPQDSIITLFSKLPSPERFVTKDTTDLKWNDNWRHLESLNLYAISYLSDGLKVKGFLLEPKGDGKHPCILFNRGGNREFAMLNPIRMIFIGSELASNGYVVIASNYRGVDGGEGMEEFGGKEVNDVLNLIPALNHIEKADTSRIGMFGWSRGGMMTYIAMTKTDRLKAAVVGGAISDQFATISDRPEMEINVIAELVPDYANNKVLELEKRSAIRWPEKFPKNVPLLILHGNSDWRVKAEQSLSLALELEKHRIPYRLIIFEGADHGIREFGDEVDHHIVSWFDKYLKNRTSLPNMEYHGR